jgi:hypothetical protein
MLGNTNGAGIHESVHPCTTASQSIASPQDRSGLLRQDAAQPGPLRRGEGAQEKSAGGRTRCAPVRRRRVEALLLAEERKAKTLDSGLRPNDEKKTSEK